MEIATPNFTPEIQGGDLAAFDEYRCFLVDPQLPGDRFLTGYDVRPGNDAIVHHVLVMPVDPDLVVADGMTNAEVMQAASRVRRAVNGGARAASEFCRGVAARVAESREYRSVVEVRVVGARFDPIAYFEHGPEPEERFQVTSCRVKR